MSQIPEGREQAMNRDERERRRKLAEIENLGVPAWPNRFAASHTLEAASETYRGPGRGRTGSRFRGGSDGAGRRPDRRDPIVRKGGVPAPLGRTRNAPGAYSARRASRARLRGLEGVGPRGLWVGSRRPHVPDPNRGTDRSCRLPRLPGEGPPAAPREVARPCRPGHPLPAALPGPARESADPRGVPPPGRNGFVDAPLHGRRGFSGSRDPHAPAARHRGGGAAVPDPAPGPRDRPLPAGGARALPEAPRGRGVPAGLRDQPQLPERGALHPAQPRVHHAGVLPGVQRLRRHDGSHRAPGDRRGRRRAVRRAGGLRGRGDPLRKALRPGFALRGYAGGAPRAGSRSRGRRPPVRSGPSRAPTGVSTSRCRPKKTPGRCS